MAKMTNGDIDLTYDPVPEGRCIGHMKLKPYEWLMPDGTWKPAVMDEKLGEWFKSKGIARDWKP